MCFSVQSRHGRLVQAPHEARWSDEGMDTQTAIPSCMPSTVSLAISSSSNNSLAKSTHHSEWCDSAADDDARAVDIDIVDDETKISGLRHWAGAPNTGSQFSSKHVAALLSSSCCHHVLCKAHLGRCRFISRAWRTSMGESHRMRSRDAGFCHGLQL